jgi:hypothetical protein
MIVPAADATMIVPAADATMMRRPDGVDAG